MFFESVRLAKSEHIEFPEKLHVAGIERDFESVRGSKRYYWRNPSVSLKVGQTVCLDESESIGVVEAIVQADL